MSISSPQATDQPPATCPAHADLLRTEQTCWTSLDRLKREERFRAARDEDRTAAETILEDAAGACRRATAVFRHDPTLADEPWLREVDVFVELVRQLTVMVLRVLSALPGPGLNGRSGKVYTLMWHEAQVLAERIPALAENVLACARPDHDTPAGQQAISLTRLHRNLDGFPDAVADLRHRVQLALAMDQPHPHALEIASLLDQLTARVDAAQAEAGNR